MPGIVTKIIGDEIIEFKPADYIGAEVGTEIVPGSSLPSYAQEKMERITAFIHSIQGIENPQLLQSLSENSDIPEIREMLKGQQQGMQNPGLGTGEGSSPEALNIPLDMAI